MNTASSRQSVGGNQRYRKGLNCPICGGSEDDGRGNGSRCYGFLSDDGKFAHCTREEKSGSLTMNPNSTSFAHKLKGDCKCGVEHAPAEPKATRGRKAHSPILATYDYFDEAGTLLFQVQRRQDKTFVQRRPDKIAGTYVYSLKGVRRVLYRLPELVASDATESVFFVEGEKDVDNLRGAGLVATCNPMGAGKWRSEYATSLSGRIVYVIADNDDVGREHARDVARSLAAVAGQVKVLDLTAVTRELGRGDLPEKGDASDFLKMGGTAESLKRAFHDAPAQPRFKVVDPEGTEEDGSDPDGRADEPLVNKADDDPHRLARLFIKEEFSLGKLTKLVYYRDEFQVWDGSSYKTYRDSQGDLVAAVEREFNRLNSLEIEAIRAASPDRQVPLDKLPVAKKVTTSIVNNTMLALKSESVLSWDAESPCWLDEDGIDRPHPLDILPTSNGLLDLSTMKLIESTPRFFSPFALNYAYSATPDEPKLWKQFLGKLWPDDDAARRELQKWFGYFLTPDTRQQKIFLLIGPLRSGKGTIARVLERMIGDHNVASPTLTSLATNFGLWNLIGKTVAIVKDARLTGSSSEKAIVVERMLNISGEDKVDIDKKYQKPTTQKLFSRLVIISNETPNLRDSSGALAGRMMPLKLESSWFGKEDIDLTDKLYGEMQGILQWAIEGRRLLEQDRRFITPKSAEDIAEGMSEIASPVKTFAVECCTVLLKDTRDSGDLEPIRDLYFAFREWTRITGMEPGSENIFGRNMQAAFSHLKVERPRAEDDSRLRCYRGIQLSDYGQKLKRESIDRNNQPRRTGYGSAY